MQMQVEENIFLDRVMNSLSAAFALLATLLASIGLYGVMAYSVQSTTLEIAQQVETRLGELSRTRILFECGYGWKRHAAQGVSSLVRSIDPERESKPILLRRKNYDIAVAVVVWAYRNTFLDKQQGVVSASHSTILSRQKWINTSFSGHELTIVHGKTNIGSCIVIKIKAKVTGIRKATSKFEVVPISGRWFEGESIVASRCVGIGRHDGTTALNRYP